MRPMERDALIEALSSAYRERDAFGRIQPAPAWWDLSPEDREEAFECQLVSRNLERVVDPDGLSSTARAVLQRAERLQQLGEDED
jgi:hypothetical protein